MQKLTSPINGTDCNVAKMFATISNAPSPTAAQRTRNAVGSSASVGNASAAETTTEATARGASSRVIAGSADSVAIRRHHSQIVPSTLGGHGCLLNRSLGLSRRTASFSSAAGSRRLTANNNNNFHLATAPGLFDREALTLDLVVGGRTKFCPHLLTSGSPLSPPNYTTVADSVYRSAVGRGEALGLIALFLLSESSDPTRPSAFLSQSIAMGESGGCMTAAAGTSSGAVPPEVVEFVASQRAGRRNAIADIDAPSLDAIDPDALKLAERLSRMDTAEGGGGGASTSSANNNNDGSSNG